MSYVTRHQRAEKRKKKLKTLAMTLIVMASLCIAGFFFLRWRSSEQRRKALAALQIPAYTGEPYAVIHDNLPFFADEEKTVENFESYSELDALGRCGVAYANLSRALMPTEERGDIGNYNGSVKSDTF